MAPRRRCAAVFCVSSARRRRPIASAFHRRPTSGDRRAGRYCSASLRPINHPAPKLAFRGLDAEARQPSELETGNMFSKDSKIKGDLICNGDIQIDGEVEGDVQGRSITVGEGADVHGTISSDNIRICGSVNGQLKGQSVVLAKTAKL